MKHALEPLRHAPFRYLAIGRMVTMLGNAAAPIALAFAVLDLTGSVRDLGLVVGARSLANVAFMLFGGVIADRLPRQFVMVVSSALAAVTQGAVAALVLTHTATIPLLIVLGAVNGTVSAFAFPAALAIMAQTVPISIRRQANALSRMGTSTAMIVGAAGGGLVVAAVGAGWGLAADAATFALAAFFFARIKVTPVRTEQPSRVGVFRELREGWAEFTSRSWLWAVVLGFCFYNMAFVGALQVLGPGIADQTFGRRGWGIVLAAETAGLVAGAVLALRIRPRRLLLTGVVCCFGVVPLLAALALAPSMAVLVPAAFVSGVAIEQFGIAWETTVQEHVPTQMLARVYSYDALGSFIAIPIGQVSVGPLALAVGFDAAVLIAAAVAALAVVGMLASRQVRRLEHLTVRPPVADPAPRQPAPAL